MEGKSRPSPVPHAASLVGTDWERVYRASPTPLAFCDRSLKLVAANERFTHLVRASARDVVGRFVADVLPGLADSLVPLLLRVVDENTGIANAEIEGEIAEGSDQRRWWDVDANALHGEGGACSGVVFSIEDISGAKANEERIELLNQQLSRRVAELETLLHVIPIGISIARDPKCRVVTNNAFQSKLMGHAPNENASIDPSAPERQSSYRVSRNGHEMSADELPMHRALKSRREVHDVEFDVVVRDGRRLTMVGYGAPLFDENGAPRGAIAAFVDISARKHAENALRESEKRFRILAEAIPQIVWTAHPNGGVDFVNSRWRELTGAPTFDCLGEGWLWALHVDDRTACQAKWDAALASGAAFEAEARLRRHDGAWRWHLLRAVPLVRDVGEVAQWFGTMTDIDAQKRVEQEREHLLVLEKVARAEAEQTQRRANLLEDAMRSLASSLDYDTALASIPFVALGELGDIALLEVLQDDDDLRRIVRASSAIDNGALRRLTSALEHSRPGVLFALTGGRADFESNVDAKWIASNTSDEVRAAIASLGFASVMSVALEVRGRVLGALTLVFAGTRRHTRSDLALAEQLGARAALAIDNARLYRESQTASVAKDRFLAAVSHELRTPLTAIMGWTRMLRREGLGGQSFRKAVDVIERNAKMQSRLVDDVLDLMRASTNSFALTPREMDLGAAVAAAVDMVSPEADERGVTLSYTPPDAKVEMFGDPERLQQVAWNLLSNALKFTSRGGNIAVSVSAAGGEARLEVVDDGEGIPPDFIAHVFQPFHQATRTEARHGGLGLGLAIVRQIVDLHDGRVTAHSDGVGHGAKFVVRLPVIARGGPCPG